jgi:ribonuclease BN (tRNA processing enzyme)
MRVLLLGTTGYHPTATRHTACVLLPELGIVLDAGTGMFRVAKHLQTDTLDVLLTHAHLDHVIGLTYFFSLLHEHPLSKICVHAEPAKLRVLKDHLFSPDLFPAEPPFEWCELTGPLVTTAEVRVTPFTLEHPGGSLGFRVESGGKSLAYVTDTTANPKADYVEHIRGVDLLIHECNFPNGYTDLAVKTGHSCLEQVALVAREARVKRMVLVHFDPVLGIREEQLAAARQIFPELEPGHDEQEILV